LKEEGLFRKSGSIARIREIQNLYNQGLPAAYDQYEVHVAACVFKSFFRELPESLLSENNVKEIMSLHGLSSFFFFFYKFINNIHLILIIYCCKTALDPPDQVDVIRDIINKKISKNNYKILKYLIEFLDEVNYYFQSIKFRIEYITN
jgi:hypothetical protein